MDKRKENIINMLMKIHNQERIKMIEKFLILTLKREQEHNEKD